MPIPDFKFQIPNSAHRTSNSGNDITEFKIQELSNLVQPGNRTLCLEWMAIAVYRSDLSQTDIPGSWILDTSGI
jgi:hypothetical protein